MKNTKTRAAKGIFAAMLFSVSFGLNGCAMSGLMATLLAQFGGPAGQIAAQAVEAIAATRDQQPAPEAAPQQQPPTAPRAARLATLPVNDAGDAGR